MRCDLCTEPAMAFRPGSEPVEAPGPFDAPLLLGRGERRRAWCLYHWKLQFGLDEVAA